MKYKSFFILVLVFLFAGCMPSDNKNKGIVFSWSDEAVREDSALLFETVNVNGANAVYQYFDDEMSQEEAEGFIEKAKKENIDVYLLDGDASWGEDETGRRMLETVGRAKSYKDIAGVVLDVEPYLLDSWEEDGEELMSSFVKGLEKTYEYAKEKEITLGVCVPFFYDDVGFEKELEQIVQNCDILVVMNYRRDEETERIKAEAYYAEKYEKAIINVFELQKPGEHELTEKNTYYHAGLNALRDNYKKLEEAYPNAEMSFGLHEFRVLQEVMNNESGTKTGKEVSVGS